MALVGKAEYERRSWDLAWEMAKGVPIAFGANVLFWLLGYHGGAFAGLGFAAAMPLMVAGMGMVSGATNEDGLPLRSVSIAGQLGALAVLYYSLAFA